MSDEFNGPGVRDAKHMEELRQRVKQLWVVLAVFCGASVICFCLLWVQLMQQSRTLNKVTDDVIFGRFVHYEAESDDYVKPITNAIQFFHDGYSVQFSAVDYTANGLFLSGEIGNPNEYRVSNLNLNFAARPYPVNVRDKWDRGNKNTVGWPPEWDIGNAQARVPVLDAGHTAKFSVTIPNVKQSAEQIRIAIIFSGESYTYLNGR